jgi:hypothetical protein
MSTSRRPLRPSAELQPVSFARLRILKQNDVAGYWIFTHFWQHGGWCPQLTKSKARPCTVLRRQSEGVWKGGRGSPVSREWPQADEWPRECFGNSLPVPIPVLNLPISRPPHPTLPLCRMIKSPIDSSTLRPRQCYPGANCSSLGSPRGPAMTTLMLAIDLCGVKHHQHRHAGM